MLSLFGKRASEAGFRFFSEGRRHLAKKVTSVASLKTGPLSDNPVLRLQQKAVRSPENLSPLLASAQSVLSDDTLLTADTETTGLYNDKHGMPRVIEFALVASRHSVIESSNHYLINPKRPIDSKARAIHGIHNERVKTRPIFSSFLNHIISILDLYPDAKLWFHNAAFDKRMLKQELALCGPKTKTLLDDRDICCSLTLARLLKPKENKLDDLLAKYGIDASSRRNGHGALIDSVLLAELLPKLAEDLMSTAHQALILDDMLAYHGDTKLSRPNL